MPRRSAQVLTPELLVSAYAQGVFPMGMDDGTIAWFSPDPRGLIPLDERFRVSRSLRATIRRSTFEVRTDTAFRAVMQACAERDETWITAAILHAYGELHDHGLAHSVEAWRGGELVGGLYGVALGGAFFGESMFSRETDASKVCLVALVDRLRARGFALLDTQWTTPHLRQFGAYDVPREAYVELLALAVQLDRTW